MLTAPDAHLPGEEPEYLAERFLDALPRATLLKIMKEDGIHLTHEVGGGAAGRLLFETLSDNGLL